MIWELTIVLACRFLWSLREFMANPERKARGSFAEEAWTEMKRRQFKGEAVLRWTGDLATFLEQKIS